MKWRKGAHLHSTHTTANPFDTVSKYFDFGNIRRHLRNVKKKNERTNDRANVRTKRIKSCVYGREIVIHCAHKLQMNFWLLFFCVLVIVCVLSHLHSISRY